MIPTSQEIGTKAHKMARVCATVVVFIYVIVADLISLTYRAGYALGQRIHEINDELSAIVNPKDTPTPAPAPAPVFSHPHFDLFNEIYSSHTVKQLKEMVGTKKKYLKHELVGCVLELAY